MKSFEPGVLERQAVPAALLGTVRRLGEYRAGERILFDRRPAGVFTRLRDVALRESVESYSRRCGAPVPAGQLARVTSGEAEPDNRCEQDLAGYADVLAHLPRDIALDRFTPSVARHLHAALFARVPEGGGSWKLSDDPVTEMQPDGSTSVVFTPVPAYGVDAAMNRLHEGFLAQARAGAIDPLLLIPSYLLDFLCIHPFDEGNARMLRVLARVLLDAAGYRALEFISFDRLLEDAGARYSAALHASSRGWHQAKHGLADWWGFFLGTLLEACETLEREAGSAAPPRGAKADMVADAVQRLPRDFRYVDLERLVPAVSRPTINRALRRLRAARLVHCVRPGRHARWQRIGD